ncbi:MAG: hypothetical protein CSA62_05800 [Planctomycetota bacterium]|nr:MAG: hypothetical protein CSA62_05800 [Planctomycetota bacterium]
MSVDPKPVYRALVAGLLVPGLGHLLQGRAKTAVLAFLLPVALFVLGFGLIGERLFAFSASFGGGSLLGSILGFLPLHLIPEGLNFAPALVAWLAFGPENILEPGLRLPLANEHLGLALTAASGYLNVFFATDAAWGVGSTQYFESRSALKPNSLSLRTQPAFSAFLAWLIPGAGYFWEGRRALGFLCAGSLFALFGMGLYFSGFCGCDRSQLYWWWAAQSGNGLATLLGNVLLGPLQITEDLPHVDLGVTLLSIAGLLNLAVAVDVYTLAERRRLGLSDQATSNAGAREGQR